MVQKMVGPIAIVIALAAGAASARADRPDIWSGFYIGATGGYGLAGSGIDLAGGIAGVHAGYNWWWNGGVIGVEADYAWSNIGTSWAQNDGLYRYDFAIDHVWTARARLGLVVAPQLLVYGTAGYAGIGASNSTTFNAGAVSAVVTDNGAIGGGGAEYAFTPNIIVRSEVLVGHDLQIARGGLSYKF